MSAPAKFLFDNDFGHAERRKKPPGVPEALHEAAVEAARHAGFQAGLAQGRAEAALAAEQQTAAVLERVAVALAAMTRDLGELEQRLEAEAVEVAVAMAGKLAPALVSREPFAEVAALASDCFKSLVGAPHVVIRVNDISYEAAKSHLANIASASGFAGRLVVLAEPYLAAGDCRMEWADGGVVRSRAQTESAIAEAVGRYLAGRGDAVSSIPEH